MSDYAFMKTGLVGEVDEGGIDADRLIDLLRVMVDQTWEIATRVVRHHGWRRPTVEVPDVHAALKYQARFFLANMERGAKFEDEVEERGDEEAEWNEADDEERGDEAEADEERSAASDDERSDEEAEWNEADDDERSEADDDERSEAEAERSEAEAERSEADDEIERSEIEEADDEERSDDEAEDPTCCPCDLCVAVNRASAEWATWEPADEVEAFLKTSVDAFIKNHALR